MPHRAQILAAAAAATLAAQVRAQLVVEPFNYSTGNLDTRVNVGNNQPWSKMGSTADEIVVTSPSLSYPGLFPSSGNAASYAGTGNSERLAIGPVLSSGTTYYSFAFQVTSLGAMTTSPTIIGGFTPTAGTSGAQPTTIGSRLYLRQSAPAATTFNIGVSKNSGTGSDIAWDEISPGNARPYSLNTPIFVVGSYTINGTVLGTDDEAKLWINPSALGAASAPTGSTPSSPIISAPIAGTDLFASGVPAVAAFVLRQGTGVPDVTVDELRMDTTWAQVTPPTGISWLNDASDNWSVNARWSGGVSPNNPDSFVNFNAVNTQPRTINVDAPVSLRTINFNSSQPYTVAGASNLDFSTSAAVNILQGSHAVTTPMNLGGDLLMSVRSGSTLTITQPIAANGNSITKAGAGSAQVAHVRANRLNVWGGRLNVAPSGTPAGASKVHSLSVAAGGTLDLANNDLAIDYAGASPLGTWNGSAYTGVSGLLQSGRGDGTWNGVGIVTSETNATTSMITGLSIGEASDVLQLSPGQTTLWRGQTVDDSTVLLKYTWGGDADLDGQLTGDDYFRIDSNALQSGAVFGFHNGDFNLDGQIDGDDYFIIDSNVMFSQNSPPFPNGSSVSALSSVPEPAAACFVAAAIPLLRRRVRR